MKWREVMVWSRPRMSAAPIHTRSMVRVGIAASHRLSHRPSRAPGVRRRRVRKRTLSGARALFPLDKVLVTMELELRRPFYCGSGAKCVADHFAHAIHGKPSDKRGQYPRHNPRRRARAAQLAQDAAQANQGDEWSSASVEQAPLGRPSSCAGGCEQTSTMET